MSKAKSPAFQMYASDFLSSDAVAVMSAEAIGVYFLLLLRDWKHGGLPDDHAKLAIWGKVTPRKFARLWPVISPEFERREDGRLYNPRLEEERGKQAAWKAKSSTGGQLGAQKRWGRGKGGQKVVTPVVKPNDDSSFSSSFSNPPVVPPQKREAGTTGAPSRIDQLLPAEGFEWREHVARPELTS
jgi:uncharacterized protein YdaU (DUF1376 family)